MLRFGQPALPAGSAAQLEQAGDTYFAQQRYAEAATAYRRALDLAPGSAELHNNLGITLHYLGQGQEAMARLKDGAALDPKLQRIWLTLGFVQAANGLADEARPNLRKAIQLDPRSEIGQEAQRILQQLP
jgi:Tfp pilus assembly protein PilF